MYREKSKKQAQTQHLYDTLKKRVMTSQVQTAASDSVAQAINSMSNVPRPQTLRDPPFQPYQPTSFHPDGHRVSDQYQQQIHHSRSPSRSSRNAHVENGASAMPPPQAPLVGHHPRMSCLCGRAGQSWLIMSRWLYVEYTSASNASTRHHSDCDHKISDPLSTRAPGTASRQPMANITNTRNTQSGSSGYGLSTGMKVGRPPRTSLSNGEQRSDQFNGMSPIL